MLFLMSSFLILPKKYMRQPLKQTISNGIQLRFPLFLIVSVVFLHLFEVNIIDPITTEALKPGFTTIITSIEGNIVAGFSNFWVPEITLFFVFIYIILYPFTLWYTPLYLIMTNQKYALNTLAFSLLYLYIFALPFYLFFPVTNVYTYYDLPSALNTVIPEIETFFYSTTTQNNCFPSLHTAMSIIIARTIFLTDNKRFQYLGVFVMVTVIISVLYLSIHWIVDVIGGIIVALLAIYLSERTIKRMNHHD
jgi:membrane-associated phospholipid phosphatase